ncbi:NAD(P)-binding protein [Fistulina hepatica ATCC 64428]|uniref:NAD(P)-binding protein n=1 Tax=Fistulina hepatica ATCC 64428 TaxID=1128425 RepID=A0A0D7A9Q8_9AGAR|nr:NAD(P)-binding protein [Fistulina hepatica ATCC 64428]
MSSCSPYLTVFGQVFPCPSKWKTDDVPDLAGKVIIVTGGNAGIGKETVKALLEHNAKVYLAARSEDKAREAVRELYDATGKEAIFLQLDLSDLKSVKAAVTAFCSQEKELHVLFNNAGVMNTPKDMITKDGYDLQFGTNVLGHFYFTKLLLPTLLSTAKSSPEKHVRVVNLSSLAHMVGNLDFATFKDGPARRRKTSEELYFQSKFGNVVFSSELARRYGAEGIVSTSLNPGNLRSDLWKHMNPWLMMLGKLFLYPVVPYGALTQLYAGTAPEAARFNGKYLVPWARLGTPKREALDPTLGKQLWEWAEEQVANI